MNLQLKPIFKKELNEKRATILCISNGGDSAKNETNMNKTNGSAKMKVSTEDTPTAHTLVRWM